MKRAAILLFHPDPEKYVTGAYVKIAFFAPEGAYGSNKSDDIIYHDEIRGPLMLQVDKVVDIVYSKYLKALTSYEGLTIHPECLKNVMPWSDAFHEYEHEYMCRRNSLYSSMFPEPMVPKPPKKATSLAPDAPVCAVR